MTTTIEEGIPLKEMSAAREEEATKLLDTELQLQDPLFLNKLKHRPSCSMCLCDECEGVIDISATNGSSSNNNNSKSRVSFSNEERALIGTSSINLVKKESSNSKQINRGSMINLTNRSANQTSKTASICMQYLPTFWSVKLAQLLCVVYVLVLTFSYAPVGLRDPSSGNIIDVGSETNTENGVILINGAYRPVVAIGAGQLFCLAMSRMSAFSLYPPMILVFLTKCKACIDRLNKTPFSMHMTKDNHELHIYCGRYIAFDVWIHTFFHLLRFGLQGNLNLVYETRTGLSGLIVVIGTPLICFPMMYWKKALPYEVRKALHYLFYLFAIGMCFHVPPSAVPNGGFCAYILGFCICLYTLDALYVQFYMTELIETTRFHVLPSGVQMTMLVSDRFQQSSAKNGGFVYVCLPWVDRSQWHAFSLFEHPDDERRRQVFMLRTGDWTEQVHRALQRDTVRPVWVCGPFSSPYNNARFFDNQILVASGIGITPALSVIRAHKDSRRINLIWACRDPSMLEFFLEHLYLDHEGWNLIFYTGKQPLNPVLEELNTNVKIIKSRPSLPHVIPNIIHGIESETVLPEDALPCGKCQVIRVLLGKLAELDMLKQTEEEMVRELTRYAQCLGYQFADLFNHLEGNDGDAEPGAYRDAFESFNSESSEANQTVGEEDDNLDKHALLSTLRQFGKRHSPMSLENFLKNKDEVNTRRSSVARVSACRPWEKNDGAAKYVKSLSRRRVLSTWGILYCGGSPVVEKTLKDISKEYHIQLNSESFAW